MDGSVGGFVIYTEVITKRKREEEKLRLSEGKWKSLTENSQDHIMLLDLDYTIQFINHTVPDLTKAQVIGKSNLDFIPTEYHQVAVDCFKRVIGSGKPDRFEVKYITAEGEEQFFDSRISPQVDENGKVIYLISTSNNITERIQTENALRESWDSFRFLAENAKDMIYRMSLPEGHYEYVSPASSELFGYTPKEFYNSPILIKQVIHPAWGKYFENQWRKLLAGDLSPFYEYQIIHKSGETRWLHQRNAMITNDKGEPVAIQGMVTDITASKEAEEELVQHRQQLEELVKKRTLELEVKNKELERFNNLFIGREFRIKELRDQVEGLENQIDKMKKET